MVEDQPSPKRLKQDDDKDHVPQLRAKKPAKDTIGHEDDGFDSDDSNGSNHSASAESH
jgi:hypothetical protein